MHKKSVLFRPERRFRGTRYWLAGAVLCAAFSAGATGYGEPASEAGRKPSSSGFAENSRIKQMPARISGIVTDDQGSPLAGATVRVKGSTAGTTTDANGRFSLDYAEQSGVLQVSFIGYETAEVAFNNSSANLTVALKSSEFRGDEIVVIGYGAQKKRNTTGAISSVKANEVVLSTNTNILQALAGRAPGVQAIQSSGQPGAGVALQLRANPSKASGGVLYVIDGVIVNDASYDPGTGTRYEAGGVDRSPLNFLNPNDIESIEFIKDASAASIYGARAGAGVVLINTKKGRANHTQIDYSTSLGFTKAKNFYDLMGTKEYMNFRNLMLRERWKMNNGVTPYGNFAEAEIDAKGLADPKYRYVPKYTQSEIDNSVERNPMDEILQRGHFFQHNLSLSGGTAKTRYYLSGNVADNQGVIKNSDYKRYGGRINITSEISKMVRVGANVTYSSAKANNATVNKGQNENAGVILSAIYYPPTLPLIDAQGNYPLNPDYPNTPNPLSFFTITDYSLETRFLSSGYVEVEPLEDLVYKFSASYDNSATRRNIYQPRTFLYGANSNGFARVADIASATYLLEHTLNYRKEFGEHGLSALAGYSYQKPKYWSLTAGSSNFLTDNFLFNSLQSGTTLSVPTTGRSEDEWASYFGRVMYDFKDRYLFSASIRRDGASRFAANKKWGVFPSVSAGWILSDEAFLKDSKLISFLKFRASYGTTGNSNIGANANSFYSTGSNWAFGVNPTQSIGVYYSQLANPNLTWEKVSETNLGLDFALLNNRLSGTFDVFNKTVSGLLDFVPLASDFIVTQVASNVGKTRSKGWEVGLKSRNISTPGGFEWSTEVNVSHYKNTWVERSPEALKVLPKYANVNDPFSAIYTYEFDRLYTGGDKPAHQPNVQPGQFILKDLDGYDANGQLTGKPDGQLSTADIRMIGISDPTLNFGLSNVFKYKNLDLTVYMYGLKRLRYNSDIGDLWNSAIADFGFNRSRIIQTGWTSYNMTSDKPSPLGGGNAGSYWYEDGSFLRCRNIMLGYTLPAAVWKKQNFVKSLRLSVDVQNAFLLTKYTGFDPELGNFLSYPNPFGVVFGINAGF